MTTEDDGRSLDGNGVRVAIGGASNTVLGGGSYGGIAYGEGRGGPRRTAALEAIVRARAPPLRSRQSMT